MPFDFEDFEDKEKLTKFILQGINDTLEGGICSRNLTEFRNTYVINADDSLDDTYPLYVPFNIISEMVKIVSVKVSFWLLPFRAYSTTVPSGGGHTTASGGGHTTAAGGTHTTPSGGGDTSGVDSSGDRVATCAWAGVDSVTNVGDENESGYIVDALVSAAGINHTHSCPNHTHTVSNHTHAVANHTHAVADHTHDLTFGIYEEDNSPTIKFYISENKGVSYNDTFFGGYIDDTLDVEITSLLEGSGSKLLKFTSSARGRLSVQIEIKLDISAR